MKSKTKTILSNDVIEGLFRQAGIKDIKNITSLGDGEFNAVYAMDNQYCIKMAPLPNIPVMTYEQNMITAEIYWYDQIEKNTDISVPKRLYVATSQNRETSSWFMMEQVRGVTLDHFEFISEEEKSEADIEQISMVSKIHQIKSSSFGYIQNQLFDRWDEALYSMVENIIKDADNIGHPTKRGERLLSFVKHYQEILKEVEGTMVNFDLWPSNILCSRKEASVKLTWIDPERSFYGDPMADFVCFEFLVPLEKKTKTIEAYNSVSNSDMTPGPKEQIRYALMLAYLGLIMEVEKYYRYTRTNPGWARNVLVSKLLYHQAFTTLKKYQGIYGTT